MFSIVQEQAVGLCHFLVNDCKEDLPHWKQLLLQQDGVIAPSELCGITDNELFYEVLPTGKCTGINAFQQCLRQCSCPKCQYMFNLLSDLSTEVDDEVSTGDIEQRNDWYVLVLC